jgi:hypothetical protein
MMKALFAASPGERQTIIDDQKARAQEAREEREAELRAQELRAAEEEEARLVLEKIKALKAEPEIHAHPSEQASPAANTEELMEPHSGDV